ncbi:hypothetical protein FisN_16Lh045 [Fistulifera solaris]|uniref:GH16 domain-containing protein n=1 Tax=Fistulifera solaris TaxID=1519565 RepID=A0A1Z5KIW9_FISSO|nr:hypothetical protein FisN_16Lh045 [Fistulifera solaris]|eukprot:GAX26219.1 hypothetical protein FisN_16Lh045 [Fistulifera solaris]
MRLTFLLCSCIAVRASWIDEQTPTAARTDPTTGYTLVFSDEFDDARRSFTDGHDTKWTAEDRPGVTNAALHYYNSSTITTADGKLAIASKREWAKWTEYDAQGNPYHFERPYQSGLVSTWNKFCFTGGVIELSMQLPGSPNRGGLWPAFWMLGNLARPGYLTSTEGMWPWSYDTCGTSKEAVQAAAGQAASACQGGRGRGSPEIDIIEAQPGDYVLRYSNVPHVDGTRRDVQLGRPQISSSLQVAPGIADSLRAISPAMPQDGNWYPDLFPFGGDAYGGLNATENPRMINNYWYGQLIQEDPPLWQDGLSVTWQHSERYYQQQTIIRTEWEPGQYIRWYNGEGELMYEITQEMLNARPGAADAVPQIPYEAMYLILNTDISPRWGWNGCDPQSPCSLANPGFCSADSQLTCTDCGNPGCLLCPEATTWLADLCRELDATNPVAFQIDYVRIYQNPSKGHSVTCDPPGLETREYIDANWEKYTFNPFVNEAPLSMVQRGGGVCLANSDCQGSQQTEGTCKNGSCVCPAGWTGPQCLSPCAGDYAGPCTAPSDASLVGTVSPAPSMLSGDDSTTTTTPSSETNAPIDDDSFAVPTGSGWVAVVILLVVWGL